MAAILIANRNRQRNRGGNRQERNVYRESRLEDPNNVKQFSNETLINLYRLPREMILRLSEQLRPALERPTRRNSALPVLIQVTNKVASVMKMLLQTSF